MSEQEQPQHWPYERWEEAGYQPITAEEMYSASDGELMGMAAVCEVENLDPENCIPCRAMAIVGDRMNARMESQPEVDTEFEEFTPPEPLSSEDLAKALDPTKSPVERFAAAVHDLNELVEEMLHGDPIPPKDVSLEELAVLVVASKKWVALLDAQGLELAPSQEALKREVERVIEKVQRG